MPEQKPSSGRVVHFQRYGVPGDKHLSEPRAAIITTVIEDPAVYVGLAVLDPTGWIFMERVPFAEKPTPGHWNWPPRI